jgi:predicted neuraminidase
LRIGLAIVIFTALLCGPLSADSGLRIESKAIVFDYGNGNPFDRANLYGFNHAASVARMPNGDLLAAWFSGPFEGSVHQVIYGTRSTDGGKTWDQGRVLQDDPQKSDFDPAFIVDENRVWMFYSTGRWNRYPFAQQRLGEDVHIGAESFKIFGRSSDDAGLTWSDAKRILDSAGWGCRSNGIVLSSGEFILPTHEFMTWTAAALRSEDGGKTWTRSTNVVLPKKVGAAEPTIAELRNGDLMMVLRSRDGELRGCTSADKGKSWSEPRQLGIPAGNSSSNLLRLRDGRLLLTYTSSLPPNRTELSMRLSNDDGKTWGSPHEIAETEVVTKADAFWSKQVSYPSAVELNDGMVVAVWGDLKLSREWQPGVVNAARVVVE